MSESAGESMTAEDLRGLVRTLQGKVDALEAQLEQVAKEARTAEARAEAAEARVDELEAEVERLQDRTTLLDQAQQAAALPREKRAIILVQYLYKEATDRGERAQGEAKASIDAASAYDVLQGAEDRTNMYGEDGLFQLAEDLVGDTDVCRFVKESRASQKNTRLVMNLDAGEPPTTINGHDITGGRDR